MMPSVSLIQTCKKTFLRLFQIFYFFYEVPRSWIRNNESSLGAVLRERLYKTRCKIDSGVIITNPGNFKAGREACLYHSCYILNTNGFFTIGDNSHVGAFSYINVCYGNVVIGNNVAIGPGVRIIAYTNAYEPGKKVTEIRLQKDVVIGDNVFIGANSTILPGVTVGNNTVIGAGSVVTESLGEGYVCAGVPCREIKKIADRQSGFYDQ